jgi:hypothetical protein
LSQGIRPASATFQPSVTTFVNAPLNATEGLTVNERLSAGVDPGFSLLIGHEHSPDGSSVADFRCRFY